MCIRDRVKAIISADSIERDLQLLDDPGFNDCSILESRPDNEFGYGQADPLQFVQSAGAIDSSLNITMDIKTLQHVGNESSISGISSGGSSGVGFVQIKVGGGDWQLATDLSSSGDWSSWNLKLNPHIESGNSTMYSRLVISDEQMSPVDARRVILIDGQTDSVEDMSTEMPFSFYALMFLFFTIFTFFGWTTYMTRFKRMKDEGIVDDSPPDL